MKYHFQGLTLFMLILFRLHSLSAQSFYEATSDKIVLNNGLIHRETNFQTQKGGIFGVFRQEVVIEKEYDGNIYEVSEE